MKLFKKAIAVFLLMIMALLPAAGLVESEEEESKSAFETLRDLMESPDASDIPVPVIQGEVFTNVVVDDDYIAKRVAENPKKRKESGYNRTPNGIVCQILFENAQDTGNNVILDRDGNPIQQFKIINSAINDNYEYEAVRYNWLTLEQMLYYAYIISSNYSTIQDLLPPGETFSIVVKYGSEILLINDAKLAKEFTDHIVDIVAKLAESGSSAE